MSAQLKPRKVPITCPPDVRIARQSDAPFLFDLVMNGVVKEMAAAPVNEAKVLELIAMVLRPVAPANIPRPVVAVIDGPLGKPVAAAPIIPRQWWYSDDWHLVQPWIYVKEDFRRTPFARTLVETVTWWAERVDLPMLMIAPASNEMKVRREIYSRYATPFGGSFFHAGGQGKPTPKPQNTRVATVKDYPTIKELALMLNQENAYAPLAEEKLDEVLGALLPQRRGIVGTVLDPKGKIVGCCLLALDQYDYSLAWHYSEVFVFIHPEHRHGHYATDLLNFCKWWAEQTGIAITIGITSKIRTEAKLRLYRRYFRQLDSFYIHDARAASSGESCVQEE